MFDVSLAARACLARGLIQANASSAVTMRLIIDGESLNSMIDFVRPDDVAFEHDGRTVLTLNPEIAEMLDGHCLDMEDSPSGPRMRLCSPDSKDDD